MFLPNPVADVKESDDRHFIELNTVAHVMLPVLCVLPIKHDVTAVYGHLASLIMCTA